MYVVIYVATYNASKYYYIYSIRKSNNSTSSTSYFYTIVSKNDIKEPQYKEGRIIIIHLNVLSIKTTNDEQGRKNLRNQ